MTLFISVRPISCVVLALLVSVPCGYPRSEARAQGCSGMRLELVNHDGKKSEFYTCEGWKGIDHEMLAAPVYFVGPKDPVPRANLRFVCRDNCPDNLPSIEAKEDTVVWLNGARTIGPFELHCPDWHGCNVVQNGNVVCPENTGSRQYCWERVKYVEFARAAK